MSSAAAKRYTVEEYLLLERDSETKYEFFDGEIFEVHRGPAVRGMAGASFSHNLIALNIAAEFRAALKGGTCRAFTSDMRILCPTGLRTYPDAGVVCGPAEIEAFSGVETLKNPSLLIEVLSPSTEANDRGRKFRHYQTIPSLKSYLLVAQDRPSVEHFARQPSGHWLLSMTEGLASRLTLPDLGLTILLNEIYAGVEWPSEASPADGYESPTL